VTERAARFLPGLRLLAAGLVGLLAGVALAVVASHQSHGAAAALVVVCVLVFLGSSLVLAGLTPVVPGQARVVQLFGRYRGTIRDSGLQWVNPADGGTARMRAGASALRRRPPCPGRRRRARARCRLHRSAAGRVLALSLPCPSRPGPARLPPLTRSIKVISFC
jgi:hypothetical protein